MKTRLLTLAFVALCSLLFSSNAAAQGCQVTPYYSSYNSQWMDSNMYIYQYVKTDGYAQMSATNYCHLNGVTHTPIVTNMLTEPNGTVHGVSYSGNGGCPSCYISEDNTLVIVGVPGIVYLGTTGGSVLCSVRGTFWSVYNSRSFIHIGITNFILGSWDTKNCYYSIYCPNGYNAASCPAATFVDYDGMQAIPACNTLNYAQSYHLVVNGTCFPVGITFFSNYPKNCQ